MMRRSVRLAASLAALLATGCSTARPAPEARPRPSGPAPSAGPATPGAPSPGDRPGGPGGPGGERGPGGGGGGGGEPSPKPYSQVVTSSATTRAGLFKTHRVGSKLLYEIPRAQMGKEMLVVTQIARNTLGEGYGGEEVGDRVVRWERRGDRVLLRGVSYAITADTAQPIYQAVQQANYDPIIASFNVEAYGPDSAAVVDVTRLFTSSVPEFGVGNQLRGSVDASRSFVERVAAFPENVEVEATQTFTVTPQSPPGIPDEFKPPPRSASLLVHWSMVRLPDRPMMPRRHDARVGFFAVQKQDFGTPEHRMAQRRYITRWRLEKKDPQAAVSEPVKPIVFHIDRATPAQWVPYIRAGVEDWQAAFEAAGFRNAIQARMAPSPQEDPDWSAEDARYSSIRWLPSNIENAQGPSIVDPRTGEILESDIKMYHNILNLLRDWYFVQAGPLDPRARALPLPDSLMGKLLRFVVAHEVGHTLGFPHNQKASATYPADSLRSASFLRQWSHTPSIMDYSRFNYVAQPEDNLPVDLLIPGVGPYDVFATRWGYTPIPVATTDDERPTLDRWAREQDAKPWLRFNTPGTFGADPGDQTEAVGDQDPVRSTELGIRNLRRVVPMLLPATERRGEDYSDLNEMYGRLVGQWATELTHVAILVGGVDSQERYGDGVRYTPLPRARQAEAVRFLNQAAFRTPEFLLDRDILRRMEVEGAMGRITSAQTRVLNALLNDARMRRLAEFEALARRPGEAYALADMVGDVRRGIWSEVGEGSVTIDPFRRNLQRAFLDAVNTKINPRPASGPTVVFGGGAAPAGTPAEARAVLRGELRALDTALRAAIPRAGDRATRMHLEDARDRIGKILDPEG